MHPLMGRIARRVIPRCKGRKVEEAQHSNEDFK